MSRLDKDRPQKELAVQFCLANGIVPYPEVKLSSAADLSERTEDITDVDVLGIQQVPGNSIRRLMFDCKSSSRTRPMERALWIAGVMKFARLDFGYAILGSTALVNFRMAALSVDVDLHTERSFKALGETVALNCFTELRYQSALTRWDKLEDCYKDRRWSNLADFLQTQLPRSDNAAGAFRLLIREGQAIRGEMNPDKAKNVAIFYDMLSAACVLWSTMARDVRRFYDLDMDRDTFEKALRYYVWDGRESYELRSSLYKRREEGASKQFQETKPLELPEWSDLVDLAGILVASPQNVFSCASIAKELAIRHANEPVKQFDARLKADIDANDRVRQFTSKIASYLVKACRLPTDFTAIVRMDLG